MIKRLAPETLRDLERCCAKLFAIHRRGMDEARARPRVRMRKLLELEEKYDREIKRVRGKANAARRVGMGEVLRPDAGTIGPKLGKCGVVLPFPSSKNRRAIKPNAAEGAS